MRRLRLLLLLLLLLRPWGLSAQVLPPLTPSTPGGLPASQCVNTVAVGLASSGVLVCAPVTPALTQGLAPTGQDLDAQGQVVRTHLTAPLPFPQGGLGLASGTPGGLLYFPTATSLQSTAPLPQNAPLLGGGPGAPPGAGTRSGTTLDFATILGPKQVGKQLAFDPEGNIMASDADVGGGGPGAGVSSVFGRTGVVTAQAGDYTAAQVTNAPDLTLANLFTHPNGQSMAQLNLRGAVSGVLALRAPTVAGFSVLTFPAGVTDFTATGGPGQVLRQSTTAGTITVSRLTPQDLEGGAGICTSQTLCPGYQATLGFTPENVTNKDATPTLGASSVLYPTQGAVKTYVDTQMATRQPSLGFTPENVTNKDPTVALGTSSVLYPTQGAVKSYVDTQIATRQPMLGFAPENVTNKDTSATLGTSSTLYPTQGAVKSYVDTGLATKQATLTWGAGLELNASTVRVRSTEVDFLTNGGSTPLTCGAGQSGKAQVLANGQLDYCDGAAVSQAQTGYLTQINLRWNVTPGSCTGDANAGKLTVNSSNELVCASDIGGAGGGGGAVTSVFGRTGAVLPQAGDYTAGQVTNAADLSAANTFSHPSGQGMAKLTLSGTTSGSLTIQASAIAGMSSVLTLPRGTTDFSTTGGPGHVVQQTTVGGAFSVGPLGFSALTGTATPAQVPALQDHTGTLPLTKGGLGWTDTTVQGSTHQLVTVSGPPTVGKQLTYDVSGTIVASAISVGDATNGVVSGGAAGRLAGYGAAGTTVSDTGIATGTVVTASATLAAGTLVQGAAGTRAISDTGIVVSTLCLTTAVCTGYQASLGFTPENVANKATTTALGTSNTLYPTQNAVKSYVDTGLATKQASLGFTPEDAANKDTSTALGASNTLYPTQNAVKTYVDTGLGTKQPLLGFTAENLANKDASIALGTSSTLYPTQGAVKGYVDTQMATRQPSLGFTPENVANKSTATALGTSDTLYPTQNAVKVYADTKQAALGFLPENVSNKSTATVLGTSDTLYPTQNAVKVYADTKQAALGFTPENVANKATTTTLGTSNTLYPTQNAVKTYVDTTVSGMNTAVQDGRTLRAAHLFLHATLGGL